MDLEIKKDWFRLFYLTHDPKKILSLGVNEILSCSSREIKKLLGIRLNTDLIKFCVKEDIEFLITELKVTNLDFDKSFLDGLSDIMGKKKLEEYKKKPSAKILVDAPLKASSHLLIFRKGFLGDGEKLLLTK